MPHDINGKELKVGDIVTVKFFVTAVQVGEHYCNISAETIEPLFPGEHKTTATFNGKQVEGEPATIKQLKRAFRNEARRGIAAKITEPNGA